MEQVWLFFSLVSLVTGFGLLVALVLLKRLVRVTRSPILLPTGALIGMGLSSLLGIYLRIQGIPRSILFYRLINAGAWGFAVFATLKYLHVSASLKKKDFTAAAFGLLTAATAFLAAHPPEEGLITALSPSVPGILMLIIEAVTGILAIAVGIRLLKDAGRSTSRPWKLVFRGLGIALLIIVPANLLEFVISLAVQAAGGSMKDGFVFAFGYGIANVILITALLEAFHSRHRNGSTLTLPAGAISLYGLTPREQEIIEKLLAGRRDREIAEELYISPRTVDTHLRNIFRKCGVRSRLQLTRLISGYGELRSP